MVTVAHCFGTNFINNAVSVLNIASVHFTFKLHISMNNLIYINPYYEHNLQHLADY